MGLAANGHTIFDIVDTYPCFIDFEASSLSPLSYPIAVAWNRSDGEIRRFLISPQGIADWSDWDPESQRIHGIDRQRLVANGWPPDYIIEELELDLQRLKDRNSDRQLWADAPEFDNHWLQRLYAAVNRDPPLTIAHVEDLLTPILKREGEMEWQAAARLNRLIQSLTPHRSGQHDAGADVGWLMRLWEGAHGQPLRPNHGVGPIPGITDTGTFFRKDLRQ